MAIEGYVKKQTKRTSRRDNSETPASNANAFEADVLSAHR